MLLTELRKIILFLKRKNCPKSNNGADDISRRGYYVRRITFQCLQADYINTDMSYVYAI